MSRTRLSTTVDEQLLAAVRQARSGLTDAALIDEALQALLDRHRAAEINASYTAYACTPSTSRTREGAHVGADLGHDHLRAPDPDAGNHADQVSESARGLHHHNRPETPVMSEPTEESKLWEYLVPTSRVGSVASGRIKSCAA